MLSFLFPDVLFLKQFLNFKGRVGTPSPHLLLTLCKHLLACKFRMSGFVACVCVYVCVRVQQRKWRQASGAQLCLALMLLFSLYSQPSRTLTATNLLFILKVCSALWRPIQTGVSQRF